MKLLRLLLCCIVLPAITYAQKNYKQALVVKANSDTLKGYINYQEWETTPKYIEFKHAISDKESIRFEPASLKSFEVGNTDKYITYTGPISMDRNTFPNLAPQFDTTTVNDNVFLRVEYSGSPLSLLVQQDDIKSRMFVQEDNRQPEELLFYQYYTDALKFRAVGLYKGKLIALLQKYNPEATAAYKAIASDEFNETAIISILKLINKDTKGKATSTYGSRFFAGVSFNRTITEFRGNNEFTGMPAASYSPQFGLGYDVFINKNTQKFFFRTELAFTYITPRFRIEDTQSTLPSIMRAQFNQYTTSLTPQYIYNVYNKDAFKVSLGVGVSFNYSVYKDAKKIYDKFSTTFSTPYRLEKLWVSFPIQAGVTIQKKLEIFALYTIPSSYTKYNAYSISNEVYGLGVHYLFGK